MTRKFVEEKFNCKVNREYDYNFYFFILGEDVRYEATREELFCNYLGKESYTDLEQLKEDIISKNKRMIYINEIYIKAGGKQ